MQRHSFIEMTKLSNVKGRIYYISSDKKQENLYAVYNTADNDFWSELARCNRMEFKKNGTTGKCIEARELVIALPESFIDYDKERLLKFFVDRFKEQYGTECVAALHHNKRKTNLHIHLIFSERKLLDEPIEKTATRNMFYDETGRHVRTKKEIFDENGNVRKKCRIIKKGEVYERTVFDRKDTKFKQQGFLDEVKAYMTRSINLLVANPEERLKVFDKDSAYLPMKKIGKNNPLAEEIKRDNEERTRWNMTVDQALAADVPEKDILEVKQEHIVNPVRESIENDGYRPWRFRNILSIAIRRLEELIARVVSAVKAVTEKVIGVINHEADSKTDTSSYDRNDTHKPKMEYTDIAADYSHKNDMGDAQEKKTDKKENKSSIQSEKEINEDNEIVELLAYLALPVKPIIHYDPAELSDTYKRLKDKEKAVFDLQAERNKKEMELSETGRLNVIKRNKLQSEIAGLEKQIDNAKSILSEVVKMQGYDNVSEFLKIYHEVAGLIADYNLKAELWNEQKAFIQILNGKIISGEMLFSQAKSYMTDKGYEVNTVIKKMSELPKDNTLKSRIERQKREAEMRNRNREKHYRNNHNRGVR